MPWPKKMLPKEDALILYNHGIALSINNQHSEAIAYYEKALKVDPNKKEIYWDLARSQLALFDYKNGWKNYRARWNSPDAGINKYGDKPWAGEKITDKKIFVYCDQGFGDYIQCFRYINHLLKEAPNKIIIEVKNELKKLVIYPFANEDKIQFVLFNNEKQDIEFNYSIAITDLPIIYAINYQKLEFEFPYIKTPAIDNELREKLFKNKN
jgi:tetratricopeptide (TPR) repeat protein